MIIKIIFLLLTFAMGYCIGVIVGANHVKKIVLEYLNEKEERDKRGYNPYQE